MLKPGNQKITRKELNRIKTRWNKGTTERWKEIERKNETDEIRKKKKIPLIRF